MNSWNELINEEIKKDYFQKIIEVLKNEEFYPKKEDIFNAFKYTPYDEVKVVIIGQDPYHEEGQAHGLAFSVLNDNPPPSLQNIFKEIKLDTGHERKNSNLTDWAKQGVLLLNNTLTVRKHAANSHKNIGWDKFIIEVINALNEKKDPIVFILWGNDAKKKEELISKHHYIIKSAHPSPLSCYNGFFGSKPFTKCNDILRYVGKKAIKWWD